MKAQVQLRIGYPRYKVSEWCVSHELRVVADEVAALAEEQAADDGADERRISRRQGRGTVARETARARAFWSEFDSQGNVRRKGEGWDF